MRIGTRRERIRTRIRNLYERKVFIAEEIEWALEELCTPMTKAFITSSTYNPQAVPVPPAVSVLLARTNTILQVSEG